MMVMCYCILLHLYGLIGLHLRVIKRMRNEGETKAYFLDSALFLGVFLIGDLRDLCNGWTMYAFIYP
jgi:hypothetical protein